MLNKTTPPPYLLIINTTIIIQEYHLLFYSASTGVIRTNVHDAMLISKAVYSPAPIH